MHGSVRMWYLWNLEHCIHFERTDMPLKFGLISFNHGKLTV